MNRDSRRNVRAADATAARLAGELEAIRLRSVLQVEWRSIEGSAASVVPQHARFADLCIVSQQTRGDATSAGYTFSEAVLVSAGRPVVFVPAGGSFDTLGRQLLVAWNSSRACARALNDALPLIEHAEHITVLALNPTQYMDRYRALAPEQIVAHLKHHNATVEAIRLEGIARDAIADVVQAEARRVGADLIVAGAFGHPRLWEQVAGGVTRDLLTRMTLPILMSY
jgi:nucleotide-binding universal stress UspA family protein